MSVSIYGSGQIVTQVIQTVKTDTYTGSGTTWTDITGLSATITPTNSANKILLCGLINVGPATNIVQLLLLRNGTQIFVGDAVGSHTQAFYSSYKTDAYAFQPGPFTYLDSPATTSAVTYKIQGRTDGGAAYYINRSYSDGDNISGARTASSIVLMEIAYS
jgi:hypothetical protein